MMRSTLPIRILVAEDDADDRMMIKDAFEESRLGNPVDFVEDGVQLMDYLNRQGTYGGLSDQPYPGFILLDLKRRPHGTARDQGVAHPAAHPNRHPHHLEGRGGHRPHLQSWRQFLHLQARHLRQPGGDREDGRPLLDRDRGAAAGVPARRGLIQEQPARCEAPISCSYNKDVRSWAKASGRESPTASSSRAHRGRGFRPGGPLHVAHWA